MRAALMQGLRTGYVVWDEAAAIRYRRPGLTTLYARFTLSEEPRSIREELAAGGSADRVDLADAASEAYATVEKTLYIRRNAPGKDAGSGRQDPRLVKGTKEEVSQKI